MNSPFAHRAAPWVAGAIMILLWWAVVRVLGIENFILPTPFEALGALWQYHRVLAGHILTTFVTTVLGFGLAVVLGLILGVLVGSFRIIYSALYPILVGFNSVPKAALVPVLVIWFGVGPVPAVLTAFLLSFFPIVVNVATGFATIEPELLDVLRALGASRRDMMLKIGIPRSLPYFFASLKISITLAFVGSVIAEIVAGNSGIGNVMLVASSNFNIPLVFAALIAVAVMGIVMYSIFAFLETRLTSWSVRGAGGIEQASGG